LIFPPSNPFCSLAVGVHRGVTELHGLRRRLSQVPLLQHRSPRQWLFSRSVPEVKYWQLRFYLLGMDVPGVWAPEGNKATFFCKLVPRARVGQRVLLRGAAVATGPCSAWGRPGPDAGRWAQPTRAPRPRSFLFPSTASGPGDGAGAAGLPGDMRRWLYGPRMAVTPTRCDCAEVPSPLLSALLWRVVSGIAWRARNESAQRCCQGTGRKPAVSTLQHRISRLKARSRGCLSSSDVWKWCLSLE